MTPAPGDDFIIDPLTATIQELSFHLATNGVSSVQLVRMALARIADLDPHLNSIIELAPQSALLDIAAGLDHERKSKSRGPLHGIPILVKDSIATDPALGMETTAGSFALVGARVLGDHPAVGRVSLGVPAAARPIPR